MTSTAIKKSYIFLDFIHTDLGSGKQRDAFLRNHRIRLPSFILKKDTIKQIKKHQQIAKKLLGHAMFLSGQENSQLFTSDEMKLINQGLSEVKIKAVLVDSLVRKIDKKKNEIKAVAFPSIAYEADLLGQVYTELFEIINDKREIMFCQLCNLPFLPARKNERYCSRLAPGSNSGSCKTLGPTRIMEKSMTKEQLALRKKQKYFTALIAQYKDVYPRKAEKIRAEYEQWKKLNADRLNKRNDQKKQELIELEVEFKKIKFYELPYLKQIRFKERYLERKKELKVIESKITKLKGGEK